MSRQKIVAGLKTYEPIPSLDVPPSVALTPEKQLDQFVDSITAVKGEVIRCKQDEAVQRFMQLLKDKSIRHLCVGQTQEVQDFVRDLPDGIDLTVYSQQIESFRKQMFSTIDAGLTSCHGAIAETGTVILFSHAEQPRLLSLVPPVHIAILRKEQMFADMAEWLDAVDASNLPANMILISGPSKSADIEQVLAYGVHGPRQLVILLIE